MGNNLIIAFENFLIQPIPCPWLTLLTMQLLIMQEEPLFFLVCPLYPPLIISEPMLTHLPLQDRHWEHRVSAT